MPSTWSDDCFDGAGLRPAWAQRQSHGEDGFHVPCRRSGRGGHVDVLTASDLPAEWCSRQNDACCQTAHCCNCTQHTHMRAVTMNHKPHYTCVAKPIGSPPDANAPAKRGVWGFTGPKFSIFIILRGVIGGVKVYIHVAMLPSIVECQNEDGVRQLLLTGAKNRVTVTTSLEQSQMVGQIMPTHPSLVKIDRSCKF